MPRREGRIVTFYSYKGGVGRTMALANVAFLAATNGFKVLVMDWDLEAPGLSYYFRGLVEAPEARALKESPGILNLVWDWTASLKAAATAADTEALFSRFDAPDVFERYVRTILNPMGPFEDGNHQGQLDFINAGSPKIETPTERDYVDALAHFSWPEFFSDHAGGSVLEHLRSWAKTNYDFILIDSRTGLADVSGICTTQMADAVALCFILNRQNIDGVARVSAAIRARRQDEIDLYAVPMRVAATGTNEEADARARGMQELSKNGGFSAEAVTEDFKVLAVQAAANVPYYETLSAVIATDLATDPLTFNYLRLANRLLGTTLRIPNIAPSWIDTVRRRLQPRHATIDYVSKLTAADPIRAITELEGLIESAFDTVMDGGDLSDDYVTALVEASLFVASRGESPFEAVDMLHRTLDLLRALAAASPEKWRGFLTTAIERHIESLSFYLDPDEELALLEELDGLLAETNTVAVRLRRLNSRRRVTRLYLQQGEYDAAGQTIGECLKLIKDIHSAAQKLPADQAEQVFAAEIETAQFRAEIAERQGDWTKAHQELRTGLDRLNKQDLAGRTEFGRLAFEFHNRLARTPEPIISVDEAARHAVEAVRFGSQQSSGSLVTQFIDLARVILRAGDREMLFVFCQHALDGNDRRVLLQNANYWGRVPRSANAFFAVATDMARLIGVADSPAAQLSVTLLGETAVQVAKALDRRRQNLGDRTTPNLFDPLMALQQALGDAGAPQPLVTSLLDLAVDLAKARRRPLGS